MCKCLYEDIAPDFVHLPACQFGTHRLLERALGENISEFGKLGVHISSGRGPLTFLRQHHIDAVSMLGLISPLTQNMYWQ